VVSECSLSGHGQGHVSIFYIVDIENFATACRRYTGDIHNSTVVGLFDTWDSGSRLGRVMVECTLFVTHCLRINLQLHTISLVRTCRISSFCTVAWQLARLLLTRRIARSLGDSWASYFSTRPLDGASCPSVCAHVCACVLRQGHSLTGLPSTSALILAYLVVMALWMCRNLNPNSNVVGIQQFSANPKSDGFTDSFTLSLDLPFVAWSCHSSFVTVHRLPCTLQK